MGEAGVRAFSATRAKLTCVRISSIIDAHSHLGMLANPFVSGANDVNSFNGSILPWLRSLDGLNTYDESYPLSIAGGVTKALTLPGSANAIDRSLLPAEHRYGDLAACMWAGFHDKATQDSGALDNCNASGVPAST